VSGDFEKRVHSREHDKMICLGAIDLVIWSVVFITEEFYCNGRGVWCDCAWNFMGDGKLNLVRLNL
jgi:hypothetical protein